jgi:pimeloyl-ACP methyl ester carboxylesterase
MTMRKQFEAGLTGLALVVAAGCAAVHTPPAAQPAGNVEVVHVAPPTGDRDTDRSSILAALEQVEPGGTIQFAPGTYLLGGFIPVSVSGVTLLGHPSGTTLLGCDPAMAPPPDPRVRCNTLALIGSRQVVRNLTFEYMSWGLTVGFEVRGNRELVKTTALAQPFDVSAIEATRTDTLPNFEISECPFDTAGIQAQIRCGYLTVSENRAHTAGRKLRLAVAVAESTTPDVEDSPVVFLNGGPGGRSLPEWIPRMKGLVGDRTVIAFDYRGSGASEPDMCPELEATLFNIRALDLSLKERQDVERGAFLACRDNMLRQGIDLGAYHASSISADLEDLRRALGYEKWVLMGGSYGTRVALTALRTDSANIRSIILVNPMSQQESHVVHAIPNFARTLGLIFDACAANPSCQRRFPQLERDFYEAHAALDREPLIVPVDPAWPLPIPFTVNAADYMWLMRRIMNSEATLPIFPLAVQAFKNRESITVRGLLQHIAGNPSQHPSLGLTNAAHCYREGTPESRAKWEELAEEHPEPLRDLGYFLWMCDDLHEYRASAAERMPIRSDIPTLIVSGELDFVTPPTNGEELERSLSKSHHFIIQGLPHLPSSRSFPCIGSLIRQFLNAPAVEPDAACLTKLPEMRFATELPGWAEK